MNNKVKVPDLVMIMILQIDRQNQIKKVLNQVGRGALKSQFLCINFLLLCFQEGRRKRKKKEEVLEGSCFVHQVPAYICWLSLRTHYLLP